MKNGCCGCSACALICPVNAIKMKINEDGYYRPKIDDEKCINCNLCNKVCFYENYDLKLHNLAEFGLYSAYSKDKSVRETSSSGGVATEISKWALENGREICAVIYDEQNREAKHINIASLDDEMLEKIKGSKYLQSKNKDGFQNAIKSEKKVVMFGTPCQIAGFSKIIDMKKIREKFLLIDIFCHGVPTYNLWHKYLNYINKRYGLGEMPSVNFREKKLGWHNYHIKINSDKNEYIKNREKDIFYLYFLNSKCNSDSCYSCLFRNKSCADIRLGDYWGERYKNNEQGYSMVTLNTELGEKIFMDLKEKIFCEKMDVKERFVQQTEQSKKPKEYNKIKKDLKKNMPHFYRVVNKYKLLNFKKKIKKIIKIIIKGE